MKKLIPILSVLVLLIVSCQSEPRYLSPERVKVEKENILATIKDYHIASEKKDFGAMIPTLAGEVRFFGTDSGEVISSFSEYKQKMLQQWEEYDITKYGEPYDVFIEMDPNANFASIIYGVQLFVKKKEYENTYQLRAARTLKKEKDKWVIVSGIASIPRSKGQESGTPAPTDTMKGNNF